MKAANLTPLLIRVQDAGLTVLVDGYDLVVTPRTRLTPALREELLRHKPELVKLLAWDDDAAFSLIGEALTYVAERYHGEDTDVLDEPGEQIDDAFRVEDMHGLRVAVRRYVRTALHMFGSREERAA